MSRIMLFGIIGIIVATAFVPTKSFSILRGGTDSFEAHHALWGKRVKSVSLQGSAPVRGVGFIFVNLRRAEHVAPVLVRVKDIVQEVAINIEDDAFTWVQFPADIAQAGEQFTIEVSAPLATQDAPIGVRFDIRDKHLAVGTIEVIPAWKQIVRWAQRNPEVAAKVEITLFGGLGLAFVLLGIETMLTSPSLSFVRRGDGVLSPLRRGSWRGLVWKLLLFVLFVCTVAIRIPLAASIDSAYGGDAFNYLLKSRAFIDGLDPFAADPRKAPLYSLLVLPGLLPYMDAVMVERWVSSIAAALSAVVVSLLLVRLKLPRAWALAAGMLLAVNRDFQFESVQGLANTTFAFLVLLAGYLFIRGKTYLLSVASGLAFLTRYEGGLVGAILLPASFLMHRLRGWAVVRALLPGIVLALIPFVFFPFTQSLGVRTLSDIQSDDGLYIAYSFDDFANNAKALRTWFGRLWVLTPNLDDPFVQAMTVAAMIGYIVGMFKYPRYIIPLTIMLLIHTVLITAILPKDRYYLPLIPYIACAVIAGIYALVQYGGKPLKRCALVATSFLIAFVYVDARQALSGQVSEYNEKSVGQTVLLNASRTVKKLSEVVAVAEGSDLQTRAYLPSSRVVIAPDSLRDVDAQLALLREKQVAYIIDTTENPYFTKLIEQRGELFEQIAIFKTKWGDDTATLYRIKPT